MDGDDEKTYDLSAVFNAAKKAFKTLHNRETYKPEDIGKVKAYKNLVDETRNVINTAIPHDVPTKMREYLEKDIHIFSGLKTHAQLTEARSLLMDNGKVRSYESFEQKVTKINEAYNRDYLQAEYQFAVSSAESAANWNNLQDDTDRYWLEYRTAGDERVRAEHRALHGICLPKNDPFWQEYYPPNGWRCRCVAVEVLADDYTLSDSKKSIKKGETATTTIGKSGKNTAEMFRFNPGIEKKVFPSKNTYSKVVGADKVKNIIANIPKVPDWKTIKKYENGGEIKQHELVDPLGHDYKRVKQVVEFFAKQGSKTEILPKYHNTKNNSQYDEVYADLKDTKFYGKCPDVKIDGQYFEHEGFESDNAKNALKNMLNHGLKQSNHVIIDKPDLTLKFIERNIYNRVYRNGQDIEEVWILEPDGNLERIFKKAETH